MLFLLVFCPPLDRAPVDNEHPIFDQGPIGWHAPAVTSLLKRFQEIPLSEEEEAAVDGDIQVLNRLLQRLKVVPTPSEGQRREPLVIPVSSIFPAKHVVTQ